ncbi:MAG: ABC transporter substrate-binding protein [Firmicutes bacterium]|nr:ABC transporter substrate-binding protein [Bacillota bacterium]
MNRKNKSALFFLLLMFVVCCICGCADNKDNSPELPQLQRSITDMAGRNVIIPNKIEKGLGTEARASFLLYTMDTDTLIGFNYDFNDMEKAFIVPQCYDLPSFGQGANLNLEMIVAAAPDLLIAYGPLTDSFISAAQELQIQTEIPCIILDGSMLKIPQVYRFLGEIFAKEQRGEELAKYAEKALDFASAINVVEEKRRTVYYGNGVDNLETAPQGSSNAELLELTQAINVAVIEGEITSRISVSAEQILGWNPEIILLNGEPGQSISATEAVNRFLADKRYRDIRAVKSGTVYAIPKYPYSWFDRPNGPNRLIGIYWLANLLYPEEYYIDIKAKAREFYLMFYHINLSDEQLTELLGE